MVGEELESFLRLKLVICYKLPNQEIEYNFFSGLYRG